MLLLARYVSGLEQNWGEIPKVDFRAVNAVRHAVPIIQVSAILVCFGKGRLFTKSVLICGLIGLVLSAFAYDQIGHVLTNLAVRL